MRTSAEPVVAGQLSGKSRLLLTTSARPTPRSTVPARCLGQARRHCPHSVEHSPSTRRAGTRAVPAPDADSHTSPRCSRTACHAACCTIQTRTATTEACFTSPREPADSGDKKAVPKAAFARCCARRWHHRRSCCGCRSPAAGAAAALWSRLLMRRWCCRPYRHRGTRRWRALLRAGVSSQSRLRRIDLRNAAIRSAGNDARLDTAHWSFRPVRDPRAHLVTPQKDLGLPHVSQASPRRCATACAGSHEDECYNDGSAFKLTAATGAA